jgi:hypothetical protein
VNQAESEPRVVNAMLRQQFTIFVEDAQEYVATFTSFRRHFRKQKMGTPSLDHNKNAKKLKIYPELLRCSRDHR